MVHTQFAVKESNVHLAVGQFRLFAERALEPRSGRVLTSIDLKQVFVSAKFESDAARNRIEIVRSSIAASGYQSFFAKHDCNLGYADDQVRDAIRCSPVTIADWSDPTPNIAYETGFALGLGKPVYILRDFVAPRLRGSLAGFWSLEFLSLEELKASLDNRLPKWLALQDAVAATDQVVPATRRQD